MERQIDLFGKTTNSTHTNEKARGELSLLKSILQKSIRRGFSEKAMFTAYKLASLNWWSCWKRLSVIADEDVGQPEVITVVDVLYRKFMALKKYTKEGKLSWDMKRCVVCAAKILAEAPKDRRADEFLELMEILEKQISNKEIDKIRDELETIPDEALDMHTLQGRKMGRGDLHWYETSSETTHKTPEYEQWHKWFKPLMIEITKRKID